MLKAALHVHSTYSDGELTLAQVRDRFRAAGCRVVCMADHADAFTAESLREYVEECAALSTDDFRFVAGLEFGCRKRMHIVGYGVTTLIDSDDPETVIQHIRKHSGIAMIAHPPSELFAWIESFGELPDGIEAWNSKYDGRYAPRPATFALIRRLRLRAPALIAFYGQDFHWRTQFSGLFVELDTSDPSPDAVLYALARGGFVGVKGDLRLPSDASVPDALLLKFGRAHARSRRLRSAIKTARRFAGRLADYVPPQVKAQLRRIF